MRLCALKGNGTLSGVILSKLFCLLLIRDLVLKGIVCFLIQNRSIFDRDFVCLKENWKSQKSISCKKW